MSERGDDGWTEEWEPRTIHQFDSRSGPTGVFTGDEGSLRYFVCLVYDVRLDLQVVTLCL